MTHSGKDLKVHRTNLDLSVFRGVERNQSVTEERLELDGTAGGCDHMHHLHTGRSQPTALHTLLPGIPFVAQNIPAEEVMRMMKTLMEGVTASAWYIPG